ncbi:cholesterol 7-desaturase nvd-like [Ixodes scapularis]
MNDALLKSQFFIYGCLVATIVWILWTYYKRDSSKTQKKNRPVSQRYIRDETQPVFPNGWIPLLLSSELGINKVKSLNVLVIFEQYLRRGTQFQRAVLLSTFLSLTCLQQRRTYGGCHLEQIALRTEIRLAPKILPELHYWFVENPPFDLCFISKFFV